MSVSSLRLVVCHVGTARPVPTLEWSCALSGAGPGSGCNGEGLAAQEWEDDGNPVTVGTDDDAFCAARLTWLPWLAPYEPDDVQTHAADRLAVLFRSVPTGALFRLHFAIAENPWPEPADASSWYAVHVSIADVDVSGFHTPPPAP